MINMIASVSQNGYIGVDGKLPWKIPEDMKLFAHKTKNSTVIMGRKTFESIGNRPLPNRRNIVISRLAYGLGVINDEGIEVFGSVADALDSCNDGKDVWIVGGERIYEVGMEFTDEIHLTIVPQWIETTLGQESARFPWINPLEFSLKNTLLLSPEKPELKAIVAIYEKVRQNT
jgi:dihydrofolate reductase